MMNWIAGLIFDLELDCLRDEMETLKKRNLLCVARPLIKVS